MTGGRALFDLHQADTAIHQRETALSEVVRQLEDESLLKQTQQKAQDRQAALSALQVELRDSEASIADIQAKLNPLEMKIYSGSVQNPRELEAFQQESQILKRHLSEEEDKLLGLMEKAEAAENILKVAKEELGSVEKQRQQDIERLSSEKSVLEEELSKLGDKRKNMASDVEASAINLYESLRSSKSGGAVAKVERGMCQGCRISLPVGTVQQARMGRTVVQCTSCGRILYVS